jgi:hypothetical protein
MKNRIKVSVTTLLLFVLVLSMFFTTAGAQAQDTRGVPAPVLISPHGTRLDTTPTYKWYKVTGATKYEFQVWTGTTKVLDQSTKSGECSTTTCEKTPLVTLGYNVYKWRVRAYQITWSPWSAFKQFVLTPPSFSSNFNLGFGGWTRKVGANWNLYDGYMYTLGAVDQYSSAYYPKGQFTNFDYSVRIRGQGVYGGSPCIVVRMGNKVGYESEWYPGYSFCFDNSGFIWVSLSKDDGSYETLIEGKHTDDIKPYDWNTLRVVAKSSKFWFYVNGTFAGLVTNSYRSRGYVGVMARHSNYYYNEEVDVDWVKLDVIETAQ